MIEYEPDTNCPHPQCLRFGCHDCDLLCSHALFLEEHFEMIDSIISTNGEFNRAAIRRQAMKVSKEVRRSKFTCVSEEFFNLVEADIEADFRRMRAELNLSVAPLGTVAPTEGEKFLTGAGERKLIENFNLWIARRIQTRVNATRVGKTL